MLLENPKGNYSFVSGRGVPFSSGAIADPGFAIVHASFNPLVRLSDGYGAIERQLHAVGRPLNAVCGIELRIPAAFTPEEFEQFNRAYLERIAAWGVLIDRLNPIARTNVAPAVPALGEPSLYGFYYTVPAIGDSRPAFVLAGSPEMAARDDGRREIVAAGRVSADAPRRRTVCAPDNLSNVPNEMELPWRDPPAGTPSTPAHYEP